MVIYHVSHDGYDESVEYQKENSELVYSAYKNSNIGSHLNECHAEIYHNEVKDGARRGQP